jgi:hypothetical protein
MFGPKLITVSMRELDRLKTVQAVVDGQLKPSVASARLGISDRLFHRFALRLRLDGAYGFVLGKRSRSGENRLAYPLFCKSNLSQLCE